jgi:hypothetical protein
MVPRMSKSSRSSDVNPLLKGKTNIFIVAMWGSVVAALWFVFRPFPWSLLIAGACCGALGGYMQLQSVAQSRGVFLASGSVFGVERALTSTTRGKLYLVFLLLCVACFFVAADVLYRRTLAGAVAYFAMGFVRECVTLRMSFSLERDAKDALKL